MPVPVFVLPGQGFPGFRMGRDVVTAVRIGGVDQCFACGRCDADTAVVRNGNIVRDRRSVVVIRIIVAIIADTARCTTAGAAYRASNCPGSTQQSASQSSSHCRGRFCSVRVRQVVLFVFDSVYTSIRRVLISQGCFR